MRKTLRGRPRLDLQLPKILQAVRRHGKILTAAQYLECSDAYIHVRLRAAGLSLREVLEAPSVEALLNKRDQIVEGQGG